MNEIIERVVEANRARHDLWWADLGESQKDVEPALYPGMTAAELSELSTAAAHELPSELVTFLSLADVRLGLSLQHGLRTGGAAWEAGSDEPDDDESAHYERCHAFAWLPAAQIIQETAALREAAATYGWDVPPCVVLSAESSEVIAYGLTSHRLIHVSAGDDGEVSALGMSLPGLMVAYLQSLETKETDDNA